MGEKMCTSRCGGCFFLGRSTGTCDYIFIVGVRRPCPPGKECTAFLPISRKEEFMRKPNWDTEAGREMWLEGKKDAQIADAFGISVHAVTSYRVKHWQQTTKPAVAAGAGVDPKTLDKIRSNAQKAGIQLPGGPAGGRIATSAAPPRNDVEGEGMAAAPGSALAGMKAFDFQRGLKPPEGEPEAVQGSVKETIPQTPQAVPAPFTQGSLESAAEDLTAEETAPAEVPALEEQEQPKVPSRDMLDAIADALKVLQDLKNGQGIATPLVAARNDSEGYTVPRPRLDELDVMAAATEHLSGMKAVCTACAIQALWFWSGPADLRRAKKNIDWLLDHLEG